MQYGDIKVRNALQHSNLYKVLNSPKSYSILQHLGCTYNLQQCFPH